MKIFGSGYKLKMKVPLLEGNKKKGFRSMFLNMRDLDSSLDLALKARMVLDIDRHKDRILVVVVNSLLRR